MNTSLEKIVENIISANNIKSLASSEKIDSIVERLNFLKTSLLEINNNIKKLIDSLPSLTWLDKTDDAEVIVIESLITMTKGSLAILKINYFYLKRHYESEFPEVIEDNLNLVEDLEETINDASYSLFEHKDTPEMQDLYKELNELI